MPSENKKRVAEDEVSTNSSTKKSNTSTLSIVPSKIIGSEDEGYLEKLKNVWANNQDYSGNQKIYIHIILHQLI